MLQQTTPLILASGSATRQQMLRDVGLRFSVVPSGVDEDVIKRNLKDAPVADRALALARAKALTVAISHPESITIGADQMCALDGNVFDKPGSYERAEAQLAQLAAKTHQQYSGVVIARGEDILWSHVGVASLTMRALTSQEIAAYVEADAPLQACGAYKLESMGRHLFSTIDGDNDTIQGLPLIPLLARLHELGVISMKS
jgi:septum formation protein